MNSPRQQAGFTLVEALLAVTISALVLVGLISAFISGSQNRVAEAIGHGLGSFTPAVTRWLTDHSNGLTPGCAALPCTITGVRWLKDSATCSGGLATRAYLGCQFPDVLPWRQGFTTTISRSGSITQVVVVLNQGGGMLSIGGRVRGDLAGMALTSARAFPLPRNAPGPFPTYRIAATGELQATLQIDNSIADPFLRTDGRNQMRANIRAGGHRLENAAGIDLANGASIEQTGANAMTIRAANGLNIPLKLSLPDGVTLENTATGVLRVNAPSGVAVSDLLSADDIRLNDRGGELLTNLLPRHAIIGNNGLVNYPPCTRGTPAIFAGPVMLSNNATGLPILAVQPTAVPLGGRWRVSFRMRIWDVTRKTSYWVTPTAQYAKLLTISVCL